MKQYYAHLDGQQSGPFSIDELKGKITRETMVWHEGLPEWITAHQVPELQTVFTTPPPLQAEKPKPVPPPIQNPQPIIQNHITTPSTQILGLDKSTFYIIAAAVVLIVGLFTYMSAGNSKEIEAVEAGAEIVNAEQQEQIDAANAQLAAQQEELRKQKEQQEQERKRQAEAEKQRRIDELNIKYSEVSQNLSYAQAKLQDVSEFKLLRSAQQRQNQINEASLNVSLYQGQLNEIAAELQRLGANIPQ